MSETDERAEEVGTAAIVAALAQRGVEFTMGMDIPRQWATGAQAFITPDTSILVFREQNAVVVDPSGTPDLVIKNVASVILPTQTLREFHKIIGDQLGMLDGYAGE